MSAYSPTGTRWLVDPTDPDLVLYETEDGEQRWLCEMHHEGDGSDDERDHAGDARAIALVPDVVRALRRLLDVPPNPLKEWREARINARALLAKIEEGGS